MPTSVCALLPVLGTALVQLLLQLLQEMRLTPCSRLSKLALFLKSCW